MPPAERLVVLFLTGGLSCALPADEVRRVLPLPNLWRPPGLPQALHGFLNLGGDAVPVVRTDRLFGLPERPPDLYSTLILLTGQQAPALLVDRTDDVRTVPDAALVDCPPDHVFGDAVKAAIRLECERIAYLLSAKDILTGAERVRIADLALEAARRWADLSTASDSSP